MIAAIVAVDNDFGIGYNGGLLEHVSADLKLFKQITSGNTVIMGHRTWESLPKKPLPNRNNIIISSSLESPQDNSYSVMTLEEAITFIEHNTSDDIFIIGGGSIYQQLLPWCEELYITKMYITHKQIDTFFPNINNKQEWEVVNKSPIMTENNIAFQFFHYRRKS